jgi:hypothetical protein
MKAKVFESEAKRRARLVAVCKAGVSSEEAEKAFAGIFLFLFLLPLMVKNIFSDLKFYSDGFTIIWYVFFFSAMNLYLACKRGHKGTKFLYDFVLVSNKTLITFLPSILIMVIVSFLNLYENYNDNNLMVSYSLPVGGNSYSYKKLNIIDIFSVCFWASMLIYIFIYSYKVRKVFKDLGLANKTASSAVDLSS